MTSCPRWESAAALIQLDQSSSVSQDSVSQDNQLCDGEVSVDQDTVKGFLTLTSSNH